MIIIIINIILLHFIISMIGNNNKKWWYNSNSKLYNENKVSIVISEIKKLLTLTQTKIKCV